MYRHIYSDQKYYGHSIVHFRISCIAYIISQSVKTLNSMNSLLHLVAIRKRILSVLESTKQDNLRKRSMYIVIKYECKFPLKLLLHFFNKCWCGK